RHRYPYHPRDRIRRPRHPPVLRVHAHRARPLPAQRERAHRDVQGGRAVRERQRGGEWERATKAERWALVSGSTLLITRRSTHIFLPCCRGCPGPPPPIAPAVYSTSRCRSDEEAVAIINAIADVHERCRQVLGLDFILGKTGLLPLLRSTF
ncbi:hypothetical protein CVT25_006352, partial [Psilocybe cyanescens]